jgi:hypothetical protein
VNGSPLALRLFRFWFDLLNRLHDPWLDHRFSRANNFAISVEALG